MLPCRGLCVRPLCLAEALFPWVSARLTSPFGALLSSQKHVTLPAPLPLAPEQLSQAHCLVSPPQGSRSVGTGLGCVSVEVSGHPGLSLAQGSCSLSISGTHFSREVSLLTLKGELVACLRDVGQELWGA